MGSIPHLPFDSFQLDRVSLSRQKTEKENEQKKKKKEKRKKREKKEKSERGGVFFHLLM